MFSVTKQQPAEGGQYSRREWTARLISIVAGLNINEGSVIWMANFGSDLTRYTAWPAVEDISSVLTWKTLQETLFTPSMLCLQWGARRLSTSWPQEITQVSYNFIFTFWYFSRQMDKITWIPVTFSMHSLNHSLRTDSPVPPWSLNSPILLIRARRIFSPPSLGACSQTSWITVYKLASEPSKGWVSKTFKKSITIFVSIGKEKYPFEWLLH